MQIDGTERICHAGDLFFVPPYRPHSICADGIYSMVTICIKATALTPAFDFPIPEILSVRLKEKLEQFPEEDNSISELARLAFCSKYHFIRKFKQDVGMTPHQFLMQNRIRKACRLLRQHAGIAETAVATGFCDQSHFSRCFVKIVGLTPAVYQACCTELI